MFKGVGVVCFLSSYLVAFVLEVARLRWKEKWIVSTLSFVFLLLGVLAHVLFLYHHDLLQNDRFSPSASGWLYVLALTVAAALVYLRLVYPKTQFGLFFLPVVCAIIFVSCALGSTTFTSVATCRCVRAIHSVAILLATLTALLGSVSGAMYLWQRNRLKRKKAFQGFKLPSIEWLGKMSVLMANSLVVALGVGVVCGFYLEIFAQATSTDHVQRFDPVPWGATTLFIFAVVARIITCRTSFGDSNAGAAILNIICAAAIITLLSFALFAPKGHLRMLSQNEKDILPTDFGRCVRHVSYALGENQGCQFAL